MRPFLRIALILSFVLPLFAQTTGTTAFPLTNTRYGAFRGDYRLVSDGRDFFLFWKEGTSLRMTKLVDGEARAGRPVMPVVDESRWSFDAIWTGRFFLIVTNDDFGAHGQAVSASGEPIGSSFAIPTNGSFNTEPHLAFNGTEVLLVQGTYLELSLDDFHVTRLTPEGRVIATQMVLDRAASTAAVASNGDGFAVLATSGRGDHLIVFDRGGSVRSEQFLGARSTSLRLASDGRGYRAAGVADGGRAWSFTFDANGTLGETIALDDATAVTSLAWAGDGYEAAFVTDSSARLVEIGPGGELIASTEPAGVARGSALQLAAAGGRVLGAWTGFDDPSILVSPLPLAGSGTPAAFGAAEQTLIDAVSNADGAAMVVWSEVMNGKETYHAGVRSKDGLWHEQTVDAASSRILAATDGRDFAIFYASNGGWRLRRFDGTGRPSGPAITVNSTLSPEHLIWNGGTFVVAGFRGLDLAAAFLSPAGVMSAPAVVSHTTVNSFWPSRPVLATNGSSYFVAWLYEINSYSPPGGPTFYVTGARLGADLSVTGGTGTLGVFVQDVAPSVAWDGRDFVVAFADADALRARKISPSGTIGNLITNAWHGPALAGIDAEPVTGGALLTWRSSDYAYHSVYLASGSESMQSNSEQFGSYAGGAPRAVNLSGGRTALVMAMASDAAPYHGSQRIQMLIDGRGQRLAVAPKASVRLVDGRLVVEWSALNVPVTGYRVEYRIGDGNWNELERSPDPAVRTANMKPPRPGTTYAFRVRGIDDNGAGPYSDPAMIYLGKRRAVR